MNSFPTPEIQIVGGNQFFLFIPADNVSAIAIADGLQVKSQIPIQENTQWLLGYASPKSLSFSEKTLENDSGSTFLSEITGFYPGLTPEALAYFSELKNGRYIVLLKDNNNHTRLVGTPDNPLSFSYDQASGQTPTDRPGFAFAFKGHSIHESPFYVVNH
ncbi:MAG: hypothetical protein EOM16_08320 [Bacteroidia bacterium]|nr:hypothetical protein [Bacteroidia bacterium]